MSLLHPHWLFALIIIPLLLIVAIQLRSRRKKLVEPLLSKKYRRQLYKASNPVRYWLTLALQVSAVACFIIAVARPYIGETKKREKIFTRNVIIAIDTSLSMLCEDVKPSRLKSAQATAINLIHSLPDSRIAVMPFAGRPKLLTPLTIDHKSVEQVISMLDVFSAPIRGSDISQLLAESTSIFKKTGQEANALIILSDGAETPEQLDELMKDFQGHSVQIFTIGVGTTAGGFIPWEGRNHTDHTGNVVVTKLNTDLLKQLAESTSGLYIDSQHSTQEAIAEAINKMQQYETKGRERLVPDELYAYFVATGIGLLLCSVLVSLFWKSPPRRPSLTSAARLITLVSLGTFLLSTPHAQAGWLDQGKATLFTAPETIKQGYLQMEKANYPEAIEQFESALPHVSEAQKASLSYAIGQAHYRMGDYDKAAVHFSHAMLSKASDEQQHAQYNFANALFRQHTRTIEPPKDKLLKPYLENALKEGTLSTQQLKHCLKGLQNAQSHYVQLQDHHAASRKNYHTNAQLMKLLQELIKKQEKPQQKDQPKKDNKNNKPKKDQKKDSSKDDKKNKEKQSEQSDNQKQQEQEQQGNPEDQKSGKQQQNQNQEAADQQDSEQEGQKKNKDSQQSSKKKNDMAGAPKQLDKNAEQHTDKALKRSKNQEDREKQLSEEDKEKEKARQKLSDMSDMLFDKPKRRNQYIPPEMDW